MKTKAQNKFENIATKITCWTGSSLAFGIAVGVVLTWIISGPFLGILIPGNW